MIFSVGGGYISVGGGVDVGIAIDIDYFLFPFKRMASKKPVKSPAKSGIPVLTVFKAYGAAVGVSAGGSVDFAVGYHIADPSGVGGPGIDVNMQGTAKLGAAATLSFDATDLIEFKTPKLLAVTMAITVGVKFEISVGGGYANVVAQVCHDNSFDPDGLVGFLLPDVKNNGVNEPCPAVTTVRYY